MEIATNVVAAEEDEYAAIGDSLAPLDEWSGIEAPGFDTNKIATLHCLLTGDPLQMALDLYEPVYVSEDETSVLRISAELLEKLATLDDEALEEIASELAASEAFEADAVDPEDLLGQLSELCQLAQLAESQGQCLFVWLYLIRGH